MSDSKPPDSDVLFPPSTRIVHDRAKQLFEARRIKWSIHADVDRMPLRGFVFEDIEHIIMTGYVPQSRVERGAKPGEWNIKIVGDVEWSTRKVGVVCAVSDNVVIITTEWEDK